MNKTNSAIPDIGSQDGAKVPSAAEVFARIHEHNLEMHAQMVRQQLDDLMRETGFPMPRLGLLNKPEGQE